MIELCERQLAAREIGAEAARRVRRVAVLARGRNAIPQRLAGDRIAGRTRGLRRGDRSERQDQQECEKTLFHKSLTSAARLALFSVRFLFLQLSELVQFAVVRAIELVDLAVAERPAAGRRLPRVRQD